MADAISLIRSKMEKAGLSEPVQRAFLYQYQQLVRKEAGLIPENSISPVQDLPSIGDGPLPGEIERLGGEAVVLKLNGGLGTSMGLDKAKSLLQVKSDQSFLDIIVRQFLSQRSQISNHLDLYFMNSFSTSSDTRSALKKYPELGDPNRMELLQSKVPKIDCSSLEPVQWPANPQLEWCPPGHGDIYPSLLGTGLLKRLLKTGKKYLFVSNSDNLGATLDLRLLDFFADSGASFLMEVTRRTTVDRKGGHIAKRKSDGRLLLRESAQCPGADLEAFQNIERHRFFNTNSLWVRLEALEKALVEGNGLLPLPMIENLKTLDPRDKLSPKVYQLETAMGAAIECFADARAIEVPRSRFAPVKTTSDLLAIRSDAYELDPEFRLVLRADRHGVPPFIKLDEYYKIVDRFEELIAQGVPSLVCCRSLAVEGRVAFSPGVKVIGDVTFVNRDERPKTIHPGLYKDSEVGL
jgi:UTP--glucose-1-phosphate uridylyltransferase